VQRPPGLPCTLSFSRVNGDAKLGRNAPRERGHSCGPSLRANGSARSSPEPWVAFASRSAILTLFWHCGYRQFSFRRLLRSGCWQPGVNRFGRRFPCSKGSGNADSQRNGWNRGEGGADRRSRHDSGCVPAHPPYWAPSYLPLRAGRAMRAWALRGFRGPKTLQRSRQNSANHPKGILQ
jgi:hypothetical protein